jgi:hypothetical protein
LQTDKAAHQQPRPDQQHQRERQLGNHKQAAQTMPAQGLVWGGVAVLPLKQGRMVKSRRH